MKTMRILIVVACLSINSIFAADQDFEHLSKEAQKAVHKMPAVMQNEFKNKDSVTAHAILEQLATISRAEDALHKYPEFSGLLNKKLEAIHNIAKIGSTLCEQCNDPLEKYACQKEIEKYCRTLESNGWVKDMVHSLNILYSWIHAEWLPGSSSTQQAASQAKTCRTKVQMKYFFNDEEKKLAALGKTPEEIFIFKSKVSKECRCTDTDMRQCADRIFDELFKK